MIRHFDVGRKSKMAISVGQSLKLDSMGKMILKFSLKSPNQFNLE
jgi:hypothetical protein